MKTIKWPTSKEVVCIPRRVWFDPGHGFPLHDHDFPEVFWIEEGVCIHRINGRREEIAPNLLTLIRPEDVHSFRAPEKTGYRIINICIRKDILAHVRGRYFRNDPDFYGGKKRFPSQFKVTVSQSRALRVAFDELASSPQTFFHIERFLLNLFYLLTAAPLSIASHEGTPSWLRQACIEIQKPSNFKGGTQRFAQLAGRCPAHVSREAKRCLKITPTDLVNQIRLDHSARELIQTDKSILDLVDECGFQNVPHFYSLFRRKFKTSPRKYRVSQRNLGIGLST